MTTYLILALLIVLISASIFFSACLYFVSLAMMNDEHDEDHFGYFAVITPSSFWSEPWDKKDPITHLLYWAIFIGQPLYRVISWIMSCYGVRTRKANIS